MRTNTIAGAVPRGAAGRRVRRLAALTSVCVGALSAVPAGAAEVHVAVASNFVTTATALATSFDRQTGHHVVISSGSTGKLYAQARAGAPYDLLLAADTERPRRLEQDGLAPPGTRFIYALGRLVLWAPGAGADADCRARVLRGEGERLAIANPDTAPYGLAARQTLEKLGSWAYWRARVVRGENIAQTFQFVVTGNAQAGFVAAAQLVAHPPAPNDCRWDVPSTLHAPIAQQAVLLRRGASNPGAAAFLAFLRSPPARRRIAADGYGLP